MDNWGEFETVGDEERRQTAVSKSSWISWILLVLVLSTAGTLLAAFFLRVFVFLTIGLALGWFGRGVLSHHLDIDGRTWAMMVVAALAVHLCWQIGQLAVPQHGEIAGGVIAFLCTNALVGGAIAIAQLRQSRRDELDKKDRQAYDQRLREARAHLASEKLNQNQK